MVLNIIWDAPPHDQILEQKCGCAWYSGTSNFLCWSLLADLGTNKLDKQFSLQIADMVQSVSLLHSLVDIAVKPLVKGTDSGDQ